MGLNQLCLLYNTDARACRPVGYGTQTCRLEHRQPDKRARMPVGCDPADARTCTPVGYDTHTCRLEHLKASTTRRACAHACRVQHWVKPPTGMRAYPSGWASFHKPTGMMMPYPTGMHAHLSGMTPTQIGLSIRGIAPDGRARMPVGGFTQCWTRQACAHARRAKHNYKKLKSSK